jgi:hypothetical protein
MSAVEPAPVPTGAPVPPANRRRKIIAAILTAVVFAAMIAWAGPARLAHVFASFGWRGGAWLFLIYQSTQFLRGIRLHGALPEDSRPGWLTLFGIVSLHQFLNHVMPVRLGELSLPLFLRRFSGVDASAGVAALVVVRLQEIFVLALLFLLAVASLGRGGSAAHQREWMLIGGGATVGLIVFRAMLPWLLRQAERALARPARSAGPRWAPHLARLQRFVLGLEEKFALPVPWTKRLWFFVLTVAIWLNTFFLFHETLRLNGVHLRFSQTIVGSAFANLTQTLPINTVGSFGSLEAGWTLGFSLMGIDPSVALATGLAMHVLVVGFLALSAMVAWLLLNAAHRRRAAV